MALKKSQLYSSLWKSCDELRGGMDAPQYKDYVLTLLFMKYVSDRYAADPYPVINVPKGGGFVDMAACRGQKDIGDRINKIIGRFAEANDLKGVIDQADFNDESKLGRGQAMQDRLSKLVAIFESLNLGTTGADGDDLLGDAYEYLMRHFATQSGKEKGQFYTPSEVSRIMAKVIGIGPDTGQDRTIYDPTCGSGSLLLKAADEAPNGLSIYGQEMDNTTWGLARMNMILHGYPTADLAHGDVLADPRFTRSEGGLKTFDFAVANPPFSTKSWSNGFDPLNDQFERFQDGVPPGKNGDFAFLLHLVKSLKSQGRGAIILPHGVLFRNLEASIRRTLVNRGLIKGVIGLPENLFYGTSIPACILVFDKKNADPGRGIFMIDASRKFRKDGAKNRLREQDIHKIVDVFNRQTEVPRYSRMIPLAEISDPVNDYNLNIPRYIDSGEPDDVHDLNAHMNGGVPDQDLDALDRYWEVFPSLRAALFRPSNRFGYSDARMELEDVKTTILSHDEWKTYERKIATIFDGWCERHRRRLRAISGTTSPGTLLTEMTEDLLSCFGDVPLLDRYDVYQCLMDYWDEAMQDDVYLIATEGWVEVAQPVPLVGRDGEGGPGRKPDLTVKRQKWKTDLIPPRLVIARYFVSEWDTLATIRARHEAAERALQAYLEEHTGEGGILEDAVDERGRIKRKRLAELSDQELDNQERGRYKQCAQLVATAEKTRKAVTDAQNSLNARVLARYETLSTLAVQELTIEDKWFNNLRDAVKIQTERIAECIVVRIDCLISRYSQPLATLERDVAVYRTKIASHLQQMLGLGRTDSDVAIGSNS